MSRWWAPEFTVTRQSDVTTWAQARPCRGLNAAIQPDPRASVAGQKNREGDHVGIGAALHPVAIGQEYIGERNAQAGHESANTQEPT